MPSGEDRDVYDCNGDSYAHVEGSHTAVRTRFRAETNEIVGSVTKYCEEQETDSVVSRQRRMRPKRLPSERKNTLGSSVQACGGDTEAKGGDEAQDSGKNDVEMPACKTQSISNLESGARTRAGLSSSENDKEVEHYNDQNCCWTTLELPDVPLAMPTAGYTTIKQSGGQLLRQVTEILSVAEDDTLGSNTDEPDLWSCWEPCSDAIEKSSASDSDRDITAQELLGVSGPRRMQYSWCEKLRSGEEFLYYESCRLLLKVVRLSAQTLLLVKDSVVPNVFEADWGRLHDDVGLSHSLLGGELQQMLLPFELIRGDDTKITEAPSKVISLAKNFLRSLHRSDISLTKASMNIPCVWNLAVAADALADLAAEKLKPMEMHPKSSVSPVSVHSEMKLDSIIPVTADKAQSPVSVSHEDSSSAKLHRNGGGIILQIDQPPPNFTKLKIVAKDNFLSTDYFLSDKFLQCKWNDTANENNSKDISLEKDISDDDYKGRLTFDQLLEQIARPALWDLMRKKLVQVDGSTLQQTFNHISLGVLEAIIYQQFGVVKKMSLNPSAFSSVEIGETCVSLRQAAWLHTLRIVSIGQMTAVRNGELMSGILARILPSTKYKLLLGPTNWKDLHALLKALHENMVPLEAMARPVGTSTRTIEEDSTLQPPHKKQRVLPPGKQNIPVRIMCSIGFLEQDELLDELCTEHQIFAIERNLPPPIDFLVDERNCVCVVSQSTFQAEAAMRNFIFSLARLQVQLKKCWLVIAVGASSSTETEDMMNLFFAALVQFRIETQVLTSFSCEETGRFIRAIVDECSEIALNDHRILPRLWFERPFLLEEESQFERFLVSTSIVNHFTAQSLLHKICMEDLFSKSLNELKLLVQNVLTDKQLEMLWRFVQQDHGLNGPMQ